MEPTIRYARSVDGVNIAFMDSGMGLPLVWLPPVPFSNAAANWRIPRLRTAMELLERRVRLVQYDGRGTGHSQRDVSDFSLEAMLGDLEAVVEAAGLRRFALLGYYHSCSVALAYAARNPPRVSHLILFGGSARAWDSMSPPETQALLSLIERDWGVFVESAAHAWMGWSAGEWGALVAESFREATTPSVARATLEAASAIDVSDELSSVTAPALVLHRQGDRQIPVEVSRRLADALPRGQFLRLEGSSAALFLEHPEEDVAVVLEFLTGEREGVGTGSATARARRSARDGSDLTARELEVLRLVAGGETNSEIAHRLELSVNTVERHVANLYRKIGGRGRADAAAYAVRKGLA